MKSRNIIYVALIIFFALACKNQEKITITKVYEDENGRAIYYDTDKKEGNLFISDNFYIYTILDQSEDNAWILVEQAPAIVEEGRTETQELLYNIPEAKQIFLEDIDPSWSIYGSTFVNQEGKNCLKIMAGSEEVIIPLNELLEKAKATVHQYIEPGSRETPDQETGQEITAGIEKGQVVLLEFGTGENQLGQGLNEKQLEGGKFIYAVPSFAAFKNQLFIIDAINFRILVYDYSGNFMRSIQYPEKSEDGSVNVIRDICADEGVLYLSSVYSNEVYVEDSETEDIIDIITGSESNNRKFGSINAIALDNEKNLLIPDTYDNTLYFYKRSESGFKLLKSQPFTGNDQLAFNTDGKNYSAVTNGQKVTLSDSEGNVIGTYMYKSSSGYSHIIGVDENNVIYILTNEEETPGTQSTTDSFIKVIQQDGTVLEDIPVPGWPGGPMTKYIITDRAGNIFVGTFDFTGTVSEDDPPTGFLITKK